MIDLRKSPNLHSKQKVLNYNEAVLAPKLLLFYKQGVGWVENMSSGKVNLTRKFYYLQTGLFYENVWYYPWRGLNYTGIS